MSKNDSKGLVKFLVGAGIGVGLGMLLAPKSGKETRSDLKTKLDDLYKKVKKMDKDDVKKAFETKIEEIKNDLKNLDKETAMDAIKEQAQKIKNKAEDLVALAVEKGTPVVLKAATEVKELTITTLENITAKLKEEEKPKKKTTKTKKN